MKIFLKKKKKRKKKKIEAKKKKEKKKKKKKKKKKHLPTDRVSQTLFNFIQTNNEVMLTVDESS